ncbi:hypothetical protein M3I53_00985 [Paraburkholderia sp. CNPSo 3272]|uniref:hypothetical protein n=1 Tax=Paraburkholderia sp. CNPSo 3272 TaxID=2940931 RepID=UPI0020B63863|nr:hypothetical protein [Paraburkholderia sp. CNPSo 3272]MCP3721711.1 hypothetical protein [Paraburkholderia sp. CNPSo 3272]
MSVSSADFLAFATTCNGGGTEINFRNCVSRAYYGVYHAALPVAVAHCPDPNANVRMGDHDRLSKRFRASPDKDAQAIGYVLESMKGARHRADYDIHQTVTANDAKQALANAKTFSGRLANFAHQAAASGQIGNVSSIRSAP